MLKVEAQRNEDTGQIELGVTEGGHFVAIATMPVTQYDSTRDNLAAAKASKSGASK